VQIQIYAIGLYILQRTLLLICPDLKYGFGLEYMPGRGFFLACWVCTIAVVYQYSTEYPGVSMNLNSNTHNTQQKLM